MIGIIRSNGNARTAQDFCDPAFRRIALTVSDFKTACEAPGEGRVTLDRIRVKGGSSVAFLCDPDGNTLRLLHR
ncbi:MAG: hypothetical protein ACM3ZB_15100 [bacterium]